MAWIDITYSVHAVSQFVHALSLSYVDTGLNNGDFRLTLQELFLSPPSSSFSSATTSKIEKLTTFLEVESEESIRFLPDCSAF